MTDLKRDEAGRLAVTVSAREMRELRAQQRRDYDRVVGLPSRPEPQWLRDVRGTLDGLGAPIVKWLDETREERERIAEAILRFLRDDLPDLAEKASDAISSKLAPNWAGLTGAELRGARVLASDKGLCVVWAPRQEIIRALLAAGNDAELDAVLIHHADEILDDVEAVLVQATHPTIAGHQSLALEAIANFRDGRPASAQAVAGTVITNLVTVTLGMRFDQARELWQDQVPEHAALSEFRMRTILWSLGRSIHHTKYAPPGFNRHSAIGHAGLGDHSNRTHALQAVLLLGAVLRELHWFYTAQDKAAAT
jgi:hypothetical protein